MNRTTSWLFVLIFALASSERCSAAEAAPRTYVCEGMGVTVWQLSSKEVRVKSSLSDGSIDDEYMKVVRANGVVKWITEESRARESTAWGKAQGVGFASYHLRYDEKKDHIEFWSQGGGNMDPAKMYLVCSRKPGDKSNPNKEESQVVDTADVRNLKNDLCKYLNQLIGFKDEPDFKKFGFGIGGPYNKWLKDVEALRDAQPIGLNHPTLSLELRSAPGTLLLIGMNSIRNDSSVDILGFKNEIDYRNCKK